MTCPCDLNVSENKRFVAVAGVKHFLFREQVHRPQDELAEVATF